MPELLQTLWELVLLLVKLVRQLLALGLSWSLPLAWVAWWLGAVNWKKAWPALARGAWVPLVLLVTAAALVWSQVAPSSLSLFGILSVPNFWWQLGAAGLVAGSALFCGWLQGVLGWRPAEVSLDPPAHAGHGHH